MVNKLVIAVVAVVAVGAAVAGLAGRGAAGTTVGTIRAAAPPGCAPLPSFPGGEVPQLASGRGLWAVAGGTLVSTAQARSIAPDDAQGGSIRHVASEPGRGTAYVLDRAGDDEVVVVTPDGTRRVAVRGEALHPTWSPTGDLAWAVGSDVAVLERGRHRFERIAGPAPDGSTFSPVYLSADRLAAVVAAPPTPSAPEGGRLDDLWVTRADREDWRRLTSFRSSGDRWAAIRTPVMFEGSLHFVRITGRASATREPRFELWRFGDSGPERLRALPGERYLAGSLGGELVWNLPDPAGRRYLLSVGGTAASTVGCGAVTVDPLDAVDPDRHAGEGVHVPARGSWPGLDDATRDHQEEIAVIVGDFTTRDEAGTVVATIQVAYPGAVVEVVDASIAPLAIRPGVYGALLHLPIDADPTASLAEFRAALPQYAADSWIVTP